MDINTHPTRDTLGRWLPGTVANPRGRALGGRAQALAILDTLLEKETNRRALARSLQRRFSKNPARFFQVFVMPLLPKDSLLRIEHDDDVVTLRLPCIVTQSGGVQIVAATRTEQPEEQP